MNSIIDNKTILLYTYAQKEGFRDSSVSVFRYNKPAAPDVKDRTGLSAGAIAGIVISSVATLAGLSVGIFFILKKKRKIL